VDAVRKEGVVELGEESVGVGTGDKEWHINYNHSPSIISKPLEIVITKRPSTKQYVNLPLFVKEAVQSDKNQEA